jgi:epoxyqueuosine reductase
MVPPPCVYPDTLSWCPLLPDLTESLKSFARTIGFDRIGITTADPPEGFARYLEWIEKGYAGDLWYLKEPGRVAKRGDLRKILPGARSVIVGAVSYAPLEAEALRRTDARFARYGWGKDYHVVLREKLEALASWLTSNAGESFQYLTYADTGPILERSLAERAGVGWAGKNTLVMSEETGSYLVLGEILTTLDLAADGPAENRCGTCTRCLDACPTAAFPAPYVLDSNRCISYRTIETRDGEIPPEIAGKLGGWIAGCDICQEVCPWNRDPLPRRLEAFAPGPHVGLNLNELSNLTESGFSQWFRGTAFDRIGRKTLVRNAKKALSSVPPGA